MINTLPAIVGDIFGIAGIPLAGLAGEALKALFKTRMDAAREIMLHEISCGDVRFSQTDAEESVAVVYRYLRAAQEGAARTNLRLLAQVLSGQARLGSIKADEFLYYADILTSMRRDEILLTGAILRYWEEAEALKENPIERMRSATDQAREALVPAVFESHEDFQANADGLRRTGFFLIQGLAGGGDLFGPSPLLTRLSKLINFDAASI